MKTERFLLSWVDDVLSWVCLCVKGHSQAGWPNLAKQSRVFHTMCHHAGFWWGGAGRRWELTRGSGACCGGAGEWLSGLCGSLLCFLLICIVVVPVPSVCCSVKLPLSRPTSFCLFLSILLCTLAGGGEAAWSFCCRPQPNHNVYPDSSYSFSKFPYLIFISILFIEFIYKTNLLGLSLLCIFRHTRITGPHGPSFSGPCITASWIIIM